MRLGRPKRPARPQQDRFEVMTSSILERITFRSGREEKQGKVAPTGKVYVSSRFDASEKSSKYARSHRSSRTGGRREDTAIGADDSANDLALAFSSDQQPPRTTSFQARQPVRRFSSKRLKLFSERPSSKPPSLAPQPSQADILSNFVYDDKKKSIADDQGDEDLLDDDEEDDNDAFVRPIMSDNDDEVAYFANRGGLSEFKVRRRFTLHPHGRFRAGWDIFQLVLMTWILVTVPFELCFAEISTATRRDILQSDLFVDSMFAVDILLNFNTGVEWDGKLHFSWKSILWYYTRTNFLPDLIWTFPFYALLERKDPFVYSPHGSSTSRLFQFANARPWMYPFSRCIRLLRVIGIPRIQRRLEYSLLISSKVTSLGRFLYAVLALSHIFSCVFAYLAFSDDDQIALAIDSRVLQDGRLGTKYIASFYWSIMTMTTVGYGDIAVKTNIGRLFSLCAMAVGAGVFAYGITNVVSLFQQLYIRETEHRQKMDQVNIFMQHRGFPRKLRDEVRANIFNWRKATREHKERDQEIFSQMARPIRAKVADLFCEQMMPHRMPFLVGCDSAFVHDLYLAMQVKLYLPGEDIIRQGEYGSEMYFLFVGHAQALIGLNPVATFGPNSCFGEFSIVNPRKARLATIQALDFCETHCIDRQSILSIFVHHPNAMRSVSQLVMLRSRKALNFLYDNGAKSRTLLQGLAVMWRAEGIQGVLPIGETIENLPILQEFLPSIPANNAALGAAPAGRRPSIATTGSPTIRRSSLASTLSPGDAALLLGGISNRSSPKHDDSSGSTAPNEIIATTHGANTKSARRRVSIGVADRASLAVSMGMVQTELAGGTNVSNPIRAPPGELKPLGPPVRVDIDQGKPIRHIRSFDPMSLPPAKRLIKRKSHASGLLLPPVSAIPKTTSEENDQGAIIAQLHELQRQQSSLEECMKEILEILCPPNSRFNEQHKLHPELPPLVRDRSQYFDTKEMKSTMEEWYR